MPPQELKAILAGGLERYTEHTIVDARILLQQLESFQTEGYPQTLEEHELGLAAVAAPIRALEGQAMAALTGLSEAGLISAARQSSQPDWP